MSENLRLLGAIRQSVTEDPRQAAQDPTTSPRRQREAIQTYAERHDHNVTVWAEDLDTSGARPPLDRPQLGKALLDLDSYDAVIVSKLDRLSRSLIDFVQIEQWLNQRGKTLIVLDPVLDLTTPWGRAMAGMLIIFAELELEMIRDRVKGGYVARLNAGRYSGMQFPFGYEPVALTFHPNGQPASWGYQPSERYAPIARRMVDMLAEGQSLAAVVRWLNAEGIPTPRDAVREYYGNPLTGAEWQNQSVVKIVKSDAILGAVIANGQTARDREAFIIQRAEPIVDGEKLRRVREILKVNASRTGPRINSSPLLQIAFCELCGKPLYVARTNYGDKTYRYYVCPTATRNSTKCPTKRIDADRLESWLESRMLKDVGDIELSEMRTILPADHSEAMAATAGAIGHLSSEIALAKVRGEDVSALEATRAEREADLAYLAGLKTEGPRTEEVKTGETWAQRWQRLGEANERNAFLRSRKVRVRASRVNGKTHVLLAGGWHPRRQRWEDTF